jgi:hypothetical protein
MQVFNSRNVASMSPKVREMIESHRLLDMYFDGYADLGPSNPSALTRAAANAKAILMYDLPLPPSGFIELVANQTSGKSKQDWKMTMDGKQGMGKSTSCFYYAARYATEMADRFGQDPKDYFSLNNAVLLQDTEGVMQLLDEVEKQQAVVIDDAGVAAGSREFATLSNRNLNKIYQTCRPKRWFTQFNVPVVTHVDLQIRELVAAKSYVYAKFHDDGFNLVKINTTELVTSGRKNVEYKHRLAPQGKKIDFHTAFSPDIVPGFDGFMEKYDQAREEASDTLITETATSEKERKTGTTKREKQYQSLLTKWGDTVLAMRTTDESYAAIRQKTGLTQYYIDKIFVDMTGEKND